MKDKCTIVAEIDDWSMYAIRLVNLQGQILDNALQMTNVANGTVSCEINNVVSGFYYLEVENKADARISYRHAVMILGDDE
jgi:hypothetical protein